MHTGLRIEVIANHAILCELDQMDRLRGNWVTYAMLYGMAVVCEDRVPVLDDSVYA